ncbi:hypothetical protein [Aliarcobacter cryaerophilus]|uniref:hypothetical protein n=1 Tax=Aliarcobacter cryaerophilus TaxID=28198 RepID=UPI003DA34836
MYDSILSKFDLKNITDSDIKDFKHEIVEDFKLHQKYFSNTSVFEFKNDEEMAKHIKFCESYLNYHLLNDTHYIVEIYETDDVYEDEDDEESSYEGKPMYEGKLIHKDTEEELDDSLTGRYCEISSVFEELLGYINNEILNQTQEIDDWLEDSCCPKCKGFNYSEKQDFSGNEIFRNWTCSCGAVWTERYNLTKVFYGGQDKEIKSELEEHLAYENKQMGDFLESLGFTPDDITSLIINGDISQKAKALKRAKAPFEVKVNSTLAQQILDLLNEKLFHSDTSFTHDSDKTRIFIEIGNDLDDEEFKDGYKSLKEILGVSNLDTFILVDY